MDDDVLEIDSPLEQPIDLELMDDEEDEYQLDGSRPSDAALARRAQNEALSRDKALAQQEALPYECEGLQDFDARLEFIAKRLIDCVRTRDYDVGLVQWNHRLMCLITLKYPMLRAMRARLVRLYYAISVLPGMDARLVELSATTCITLMESKKRLDIRDLVLPWRPLSSLLTKELFPKQRRTGLTNISSSLLDLAEQAQRFYDPRESEEMLKYFLPRMDGSSLASVIATQSLLVHFLPISHPQKWLPTSKYTTEWVGNMTLDKHLIVTSILPVFRLWESFSSSLFDDQMLDLLARLAEMHVTEPAACSDKALSLIGRYADADFGGAPSAEQSTAADIADVAEEAALNDGVSHSDSRMTNGKRPERLGLWNETGIFTDSQYALIMTKCLRSAGLPVGANKAANAALLAQSSALRSGPDASASDLLLSMKKPSDRLHSFAVIIAYSLAEDGDDAYTSASASSGADTPVSDGTSGSRPSYLAGSKALDHLARFIQATESYFHPSNWGPWQSQLSSFVQHLTWEIVRRAKDEEKLDCKVPHSWRLTPEIKRQVVLALRTVCLLSMFSKDPLTVASSQASLKRMSILAPDLILPSVLERAYSSLEALETPHRTMSVIAALSTLSLPLVSRTMYPRGAKHLVPLLHLCLPGLEIVDPMKAMNTSMFILMSLTTVRVDDLTRPDLMDKARDTVEDGGDAKMHLESADDEEPQLTLSEENEAIRLSTAGFEDWVVSFFRRTLTLFEALPEEGKGGMTGGKSEQHVISALLAACDSVCNALSPALFDVASKLVFEHCSSNVTAQASRVVGSLVGCFSRADPRKTLARIVPMCDQRIRAELAHGASSVRTTSTSVPLASDATLHWYLSILIGAVTASGPELLAHREILISLMHHLTLTTLTERGYSLSSRLLSRLISTLTEIYPLDSHFVNSQTWTDSDFNANSHLHWGKLYAAKDVKIDWHMPNDEEIDMVLQILDRVVQPAFEQFEALHRPDVTKDKVWSNEYCRSLTYIRTAFGAMPSIIEIPETGGGAEACDAGDEDQEFILPPPRFRSGFILRDPSDSRYGRFLAFRTRFGEMLQHGADRTHSIVTGARTNEDEDRIDCVKLLIRSIRTYLTVYAFNSDDHKGYSRSLSFYRSAAKLYGKQKEFPRVLWIRRASFYHSSRARLNSFHRRRTILDDLLISSTLQFCLSNYVGIRKTAQSTFDTISSHYDGTRLLSLPVLFEALKPGVVDDRTKGALYVLGSKSVSNLAIVDARFSTQFLTALLGAQHHSKPSIQKLVRGIINDLVVRFPEPSTVKYRLELPLLEQAADLLERNLALKRGDEVMVRRVLGKRKERESRIETLHSDLSPQILATARSESTHWAFSIFAARLLRALVRKDQALTAEPARYFAQQVISDNPKMRRYAEAALTKVLYFVKLRTLCPDERSLLLGEGKNPLKHVEKLAQPLAAAYTNGDLDSLFARPIQPDSRLRDKTAQGWLVWGDEDEFYDVPPRGASIDSFQWDKASSPAVEAIRELVTTAEWWETLFRHLSQEKDRDYLSGEQVGLIKSLFQIYGPVLLPLVKGTVEGYIRERDRHKHRAAAEIIAGVYRGSKHWPMDDQDAMWVWIRELLPKIFQECTPDSQPAWQMCVEYMLQQRDPRRALPLVEYVVQAAKDSLDKDSSAQSPWEQAKAQNLLRGVLIALNVKFTAWSNSFIDLYTQNWGHDFQEVRSVISESLADLELLGVHPSFGSVRELLDHCSTGSGSLLSRSEMYKHRLSSLSADLKRWIVERRPTSQGASQYDRAAITALLWMSTTLGDHRKSGLSDVLLNFLPDIFAMLELHDNQELSRTARAVLTKISTYTFDADAVAPLVRRILTVIKESKDSWRARLDALPVLQVVYFQNLFQLTPDVIQEIITLLLGLLRDPHLEVREMASMTLSGIVRCSQRHLITPLRKQFVAEVSAVRLPARGHANFGARLLQLHAGVLGIAALLSAFPYDVPEWMPELIVDTMALHADDPVPVGTTVRKAASDFKRTHTDTWEEDQRKFTGDQLQEVNDWTSGRADYFA